MVQDVVFKMPDAVGIVVIGTIADFNVGAGDDIFQKADLRESRRPYAHSRFQPAKHNFMHGYFR